MSIVKWGFANRCLALKLKIYANSWMMAEVKYIALLYTKMSNYHYLLRKCKMSRIVVFHLHR
jgi:hypothetical protein